MMPAPVPGDGGETLANPGRGGATSNMVVGAEVRRIVVRLAVGAAALCGVSGAACAAPSGAPSGIWSNPKNSVHVRMQACGEHICGIVVWANAKAQADAREGGTASLVGTQLFREFRQIRPGAWSGRVLIPDLGRIFSAKMKALDAKTIKGSGCLIGGFICKSQVWKRIA
jgi:uncharacterized protein (DUF2147 family)